MLILQDMFVFDWIYIFALLKFRDYRRQPIWLILHIIHIPTSLLLQTGGCWMKMLLMMMKIMLILVHNPCFSPSTVSTVSTFPPQILINQYHRQYHRQMYSVP